jgi:hypothetical protein
MNLRTMTRTELAALRDETDAKLANVTTEIAAIQSEMSARLSGFWAEEQRLRSTLGQVTNELARREALDAVVPTITDHALLRYMERVHGVNVAQLKAELLNDALVSAIKAGATAMQTPEGTFVINGSSVTTFLSKEMRPKRKTKRGLREVEGFDEDEAA